MPCAREHDVEASSAGSRAHGSHPLALAQAVQIWEVLGRTSRTLGQNQL